MKRAILEAVATGAVASGGDVKRFKECTLLQATVGDEVGHSPMPAGQSYSISLFLRIAASTYTDFA